MAINPAQLVGLQRQTPDFVGQFMRGQEFSANQERQNRVLDMQEQNFAAQQEEAEAARQEKKRTAEANYWGRASQLLQGVPEEQKGQVWGVIRNQAIANGLPDVQDEMPEQYVPGIENQMFAQAQLMGYQPPQAPGSRPQDMTSSQKDWIEYQRLLREDPDQAEVFGRQAGFVSKEGQDLSSHMEKRLSMASDEAITSASTARNYEGLAQDFQQLQVAGGQAGKWSERYKQLTGQEDGVSALRQQYRQIRNSEVVKNLPPGVASDKDIELAMSGFPPDTANPEYIASFMRGLSKLAQFRAEYADFRARYISENGHERDMLKTWKAQQQERSDTPKAAGANLSIDDLVNQYAD